MGITIKKQLRQLPGILALAKTIEHNQLKRPEGEDQQ